MINTTNFLKELNSKNWHFTYDRKMSYQRIRLFNYGYCKQLSNFFKVKIDSEIYRIKDQNVSVYYELNDHTKVFKEIEGMLCGEKSLSLIKNIKSTIEDYYKEFIESIKNRPINYSEFTNDNLIESFRSFSRENEKISLPTWLLYLYFEEVLTNVIKKSMETKFNDVTEVEKILSIIGTPSEILPLDAYHKDLYEIVLLPEDKQEVALEKLTQKYSSWGVYDVNYDLPNLSFHEEKIKNLDKNIAKQKIEEIDLKYKNQKEELKNIEKYWQKDEDLSALIDLYFLYANFKDWKNYYREQSSYKMKILFHEIASRLSITPEQVSFLTEEETVSALESKVKVNINEINKRIKNSALIFLNNETFIITEEDVLKEIDDLIQTKDVLSIKGSVAYPGVVSGAVKIISSTKDFDKVKEGDILVASTTRPDYLPFMQKSAGFITNEGGMLSHAAIMARELKKPCIIGTKIATKVLKDGDLVEVDAEKGIVKILNK